MERAGRRERGGRIERVEEPGKRGVERESRKGEEKQRRNMAGSREREEGLRNLPVSHNEGIGLRRSRRETLLETQPYLQAS